MSFEFKSRYDFPPGKTVEDFIKAIDPEGVGGYSAEKLKAAGYVENGGYVVYGSDAELREDLLHVHLRLVPCAEQLIHILAGEEYSEKKIDEAFFLSGLGEAVNALRKAIGIELDD